MNLLRLGIFVFAFLLIGFFTVLMQTPEASAATARVSYSDCWSGAISDDDGTWSIEGCGSESFDISCDAICAMNAQKQDDSGNELCVSIGSEEQCTTAAYGIAQITADGGMCCGAIFLPLILLGSVFVKKRD